MKTYIVPSEKVHVPTPCSKFSTWLGTEARPRRHTDTHAVSVHRTGAGVARHRRLTWRPTDAGCRVAVWHGAQAAGAKSTRCSWCEHSPARVLDARVPPGVDPPAVKLVVFELTRVAVPVGLLSIRLRVRAGKWWCVAGRQGPPHKVDNESTTRLYEARGIIGRTTKTRNMPWAAAYLRAKTSTCARPSKRNEQEGGRAGGKRTNVMVPLPFHLLLAHWPSYLLPCHTMLP